MTVSTLTKAALISTLIGFSAPAFAGTTQAQIEQCKVLTVAETGIDTATHDISFKSSTKKKIKLEVRPLDGSESYIVTCRLRRGKVTTAEATVPLSNVKMAQVER